VKKRGLDFDWTSLRIALEGLSYLDFPKLNVKNKEDAKRFVISYGYELSDPYAQEEIWRIYFEALSFIKNHLLDEDELLPDRFLSRAPNNEITRLMIDASKQVDDESRWACAILRIMHIICHLNNDIRMENFQYAREQIFGRFDSMITTGGGNSRWIFDPQGEAIPLVRYIKRQRKERNSTIMKLLAKPTTVVEAIYDSIGFRFVTENRWESFRLIQRMFDTGVVSAPNIYPSRSVNNVISFDSFKGNVEPMFEQAEASDWTSENFITRIRELENVERVPMTQVRNPFSSPWYRAIQFTGRQMIIAPDPSFQLMSTLRESLSGDARQILDTVPVAIREKRSFFQPFEVQILDKESYVESLSGRSRHRDYKNRQRVMARNRILRDLL